MQSSERAAFPSKPLLFFLWHESCYYPNYEHWDMASCLNVHLHLCPHGHSWPLLILLCFCFAPLKQMQRRQKGEWEKFLLYFHLSGCLSTLIVIGTKKKKKKILPLRTPEAFRVRKKAAFAFNCFPFTLKEQRVVQWNSRQSVRAVRKVSQTSNKSNMKALCFFFYPAPPSCASGLQKSAESIIPHFLR